MSEVNYAPLIDDMTWSYSRVNSYSSCGYKWYLRYIRGMTGEDMFFATFGTFIHKLIEMFLKKEKTAQELKDIYLTQFCNEVSLSAPSKKIFNSYFKGGLDYISNIQDLPYEIIGVEQFVSINIGGKKVIGYIDIIAKSDDGFLVIDNKSRNLKPRSNRKVPTKTDKELDDYLRQLYIYSEAIKEIYGEYPKYLCFNCFREGIFIKEEFDKQKMEEAKEWFISEIDNIRENQDFRPNIDFFKCKYLCEMNKECEYYELFKG